MSRGEAPPSLEITASRQLVAWPCSRTAGSRRSEHTFNRAMGLWASPETLFRSALFQLWRLDNAPPPGGRAIRAMIASASPKIATTTGDLV